MYRTVFHAEQRNAAMDGIVVFPLGLAAYLIFFFSFLYGRSFVVGLLVPKR